MVLTLAESAKLSQDMLRRGVIETIIEESPVLNVLPFIQVQGNAYKFNRENALPSAGFFAVNAVWTEGTTTFTEVTKSLAILGGDADVDNFIQRTRSNLQDQRAIQTAFRAKSVARKFEQSFVDGDTTVDPNGFDGLKVQIPASQELTMGANGGALTLAKLDELIDLVKPGKPDVLMMARRTRRKLKALLTASAHYVESGESSFGRQVMMYDGIPVLINDHIPITETEGTETAASSIYACRFSEVDGVAGMQNGDGPEVIDVGQLETKDAERVRIRWYCGLALLSELAAARLRGINAS